MTSQMKLLAVGLHSHSIAPPSETCDIFQQTIRVGGQEHWRSLQSVRSNATSLGITISATDSDLDDEHNLLDEQLEDFSDRTFSIRIVKVRSGNILKFLTVDGFDRSVQSEPSRLEESTKVVVAELPLGFKCNANGISIGPWSEDWAASVVAEENAVRPRRLVNDMSGKGLLPTSPRVWIIDESADTWWSDRIRKTAIQRLALCIPDAISLDSDGNVVSHVRSGRKIAAVIEHVATGIDMSGLHLLLSEVCRWIYFEGPDAETRHSLLASELVRLWPSDATWLQGLNESLGGSFEAARTAYRLHLQSKGVDALKLMSDLRKGLSDDVRSLANNTASLSSGLWRDAAVAFGVVVLKATTTTLGSWLIWFAMAYLVASCAFTVMAANSAVNAIVENEKSFRSRLYAPLLLEKDYEELAAKHYRKALSSFEWYRFFVILAYGVAVAGLAWLAQLSLGKEELFRFIAAHLRAI
ncbi:hypothetical protein [Bradyrhizobium nanningense]|uniref:hypothetical protein n=1 Tax=Bradyrhizobium nanningense TaxID=1325118 RepID=UPI001008798A|nr:hypothetical protein [Bradyrhizobium nanningense]